MQKSTGAIGEEIAEHYLKKQGHKILQRNYKGVFARGPLGGEIDIITKHKGILHFVEVKTLRVPYAVKPAFRPEDHIDANKLRHVQKTAQLWLSSRRLPMNSKQQIDVVTVTIDDNGNPIEIRHFPNVTF